MDAHVRTYTRGALALAAGTALAVATAAPAAAQDEDYPAPSVSAVVDGDDIITTITDNGDGTYGDADANCANIGMHAIDALPLATRDLDDIELIDILEQIEWLELAGATSAEEPEVVVSANEAREVMGWGPLEPGVYASIGVCLGQVDGDLGFISMNYRAPIFVPGGIGSIGQALDLGSSALELEGGSSMLLDQGSALLGS